MNILKYSLDVVYTWFNKSPNILSIDETIDAIINDRLSIARYGDGEFDLMLQTSDIGFQTLNDGLRKKLYEVLNSNNPNLLVCLPKVFSSRDLKRMHYYARRCWVRHLYKKRKSIYKLIDFNKVYGNAFVTRNYIDLEDKSKVGLYFQKIRGIWDKRDVVIIEGRFTRFGVGNDLLSNAKSIKRILCPEKNAFEKYDEVLECALNISVDSLILIALGPTATVMASDLCNCSYQAIDIGHLDIEYEWYIAKTDKKISISNKWVNETKGIVSSKKDTLVDSSYEKEIIYQIE